MLWTKVLLLNVFFKSDTHVVFLSFVSSTANSSLLGGGGGKCLILLCVHCDIIELLGCFVYGFGSRKHIVVHWRMESEVSNHVWGCPCGRPMAKHYQGPHLDTFLRTLWRDCSNYTQSTRHDRRGREVSGCGVVNQPNYNWNFDTPHFYRGIRLVPR